MSPPKGHSTAKEPYSGDPVRFNEKILHIFIEGLDAATYCVGPHLSKATDSADEQEEHRSPKQDREQCGGEGRALPDERDGLWPLHMLSTVEEKNFRARPRSL